MPGPFRKGDTVTWNTAQGPTTGTIVRIEKRTIEFEGQTFTGSENDPVYVVESEATGARAAHKASALEETTDD